MYETKVPGDGPRPLFNDREDPSLYFFTLKKAVIVEPSLAVITAR